MPVNTRIQLRRGTAGAGASQWTNQVLYAGEVGYETDTGRFKIGDGTTAWDSLDYAAVPPAGFAAGSGLSVSVASDGSTVTYSLSDPTIQSADITDFNSAVSGLLTVTNVSAGSGISVSSNSGNFTVSLSDPTIQVADITDFVDGVNDRVADLITAGSGIQLTYTDSGNDNSTLEIAVTGIALSGHTHTSSEITDFNSSVSGLLPVKDVVAGSGVSVTSSSGTFTVALSDPTIQAADVTDFNEAVDDRVATLLTGVGDPGNGAYDSNIVFSYEDDNAFNDQLMVGLNRDLTGINSIASSGTGSATFTINAATVAATGNLTVGGNLTVNGSTTTVNSTVTTLDDPIITLGGDTAPTSDDSKDRGVEFRYYSGSAKVGFFGYDNSTGKFTFIPDSSQFNEAFSGTKGEVDANVDWSNILNKPDPVIAVDITGDVVGSGNFTMTDLAGGTISISSTIQANSVALGTDTTGDYVASVSVSGVGLSVSGSGENATYTVSSNATSANTVSTIVARDSSGNFSIGSITATGLTGASAGSPVTISYAVIDGGTP